jgi:hypothetical protein
MKVRRSEIVEQLQKLGRSEDADRAERELPERVDAREHADQLRRYGLDPERLRTPAAPPRFM